MKPLESCLLPKLYTWTKNDIKIKQERRLYFGLFRPEKNPPVKTACYTVNFEKIKRFLETYACKKLFQELPDIVEKTIIFAKIILRRHDFLCGKIHFFSFFVRLSAFQRQNRKSLDFNIIV